MPFSGDASARQHGERVQVRKRRRRCRVGQVVGRHINRLHAGDGALHRRGDPFLQLAHFRAQRRLVSHGRRHAAQQGRHFRTRLGKPENVVDKQQHVGTGLIAEIFRHRQRCRSATQQPRARRFIHLAEHHDGLIYNVLARVADRRFLHFQPEIVPLRRPLPHACEARITALKYALNRAISS